MHSRPAILACMLALGIASLVAAITRPTRVDFEAFVHAEMQSQAASADERAAAKARAATYLAGCRYHSRLFWMDIERNGTPVYTAAFGQFVEQPQPQQRTSSRPQIHRDRDRVIYMVDASIGPAPAAG